MLYRYSANEKGKPVKKAVIYTKNEHSISAQKIDPDAMRVITHLRDNGYDAYIVGGAVRDLLVGKTPKDFDIVTDATPPRIKKIFRNSRIIGKRFRLVHVFFGPKIFEVSTFRSIADGTVGNKFGTMDEDVCRRDFSLNALYYDPIKEQIIDYVDGVRDIKKRRIEPVIALDVIFKDDPVRMLRAVKYAAGTGFHLPHKLKKTICKSASLLGPVSPSRLTEELIKIINSGSSYNIVSLALQTDIYMHIQPAACALIYDDPSFEQRYMASLKELDALVISDNTVRLGKKLSYLIYDFISDLTDWKKELEANPNPSELFLRTWTQCRNFVLPMNPPRVELEFAIRTCLKRLGVNTKIPKSAFSAKDQKKNKKASLQEKDKSEKKAKAKKAAKSSAKKKTQPSQMHATPIQLANSVMPPLNGTQTVKEAVQL